MPCSWCCDVIHHTLHFNTYIHTFLSLCGHNDSATVFARRYVLLQDSATPHMSPFWNALIKIDYFHVYMKIMMRSYWFKYKRNMLELRMHQFRDEMRWIDYRSFGILVCPPHTKHQCGFDTQHPIKMLLGRDSGSINVCEIAVQSTSGSKTTCNRPFSQTESWRYHIFPSLERKCENYFAKLRVP